MIHPPHTARALLQRLANALTRLIEAKRESLLSRCDTTGPISTGASRKASRDLAVVDGALTRLGRFDTR